MAFQTVFKRYELKYMLELKQKEKILKEIEKYMELDKYGRTTIRNIYFDTDSYRLIRHSIEKPAYKEKLRIRSYCKATNESTVFVELKKKYKHVVYKRRISLKEAEAMDWCCGKRECSVKSQISKEIDYFIKYYKTLHPTLFLSYEREAYFSKGNTDLRITFDSNIFCRQEDISLKTEAYGDRILPEDKVLMEIKCSGGMPMWLANLLSRERIYKTSFSKYGTAYKTFIFPNIFKETI